MRLAQKATPAQSEPSHGIAPHTGVVIDQKSTMPTIPANNNVHPERFSQQNQTQRIEELPSLLKNKLKAEHGLGDQRDLSRLQTALCRLFENANSSGIPHFMHHPQLAQCTLKSLSQADLKSLSLSCKMFHKLATFGRSVLFTTGDSLQADINHSPLANTVNLVGPVTVNQLQQLRRLPNLRSLFLDDSGTVLADWNLTHSDGSLLPSTLQCLVLTGVHSLRAIPASILEGLPDLQDLILYGLPELRELPAKRPGNVSTLDVRRCPQLASLPDWCAEVTLLTVLRCDALQRLPNAIRAQLSRDQLQIDIDMYPEMDLHNTHSPQYINVDDRFRPTSLELFDHVTQTIENILMLPPVGHEPA